MPSETKTYMYIPNLKPLLSKAVLPVLFLLSALAVPAILAACDNATSTSGSPTVNTAPALSPASGGEAVFMRYCAVCHPGGHRGAGPDIIQYIADSEDADLRDVVRTGVKRMPPFNQATISDAQLTELITYMRTLK